MPSSPYNVGDASLGASADWPPSRLAIWRRAREEVPKMDVRHLSSVRVLERLP